jgi:ABC-type branched-subunit amino acid transport system substrate-binding protein
MSTLIFRASWLLLLVLAGCGPSGVAEPVWIGHLAPLTGAAQSRGEAEMAAMQLTLELAREEGWSINGRSVAVRHVNVAGAPARAEAVRLLAVNRVVGLILGPGVPDVAEVAAAARGTTAAVVVLDEVAAVPPGAKLLGPDPAQRGRALARFARSHLKKKRVAVLLDSRDGVCAAVALAFTSAWRAEGELREWRLASTDAGGSFSDLPAWKPDAILAALPASRLPDLAGLAPPVPVLHGGPDEDEATLLRHAGALGPKRELYTAAVWSPGARTDAESEEWRRRFAKAQQQPPGRDAVLARDGLRLLMAALEREKANKSLQPRLRQELSAIEEFNSVAGKVAWSEGQPVRQLFLVRLAQGKAQVVQTLSGEDR